MKKLILFFVLASAINAQTWTFTQDRASGKYTLYKSASGDSLARAVYIVGGDVAIGASIDSILSANAQTVTTETDTISTSSFSSAYTVDIFAVDDTLQISLDNTNFMRIMPYSGLRLENVSPSWSTSLYIKRYGTAGTVSYDYIISGR